MPSCIRTHDNQVYPATAYTSLPCNDVALFEAYDVFGVDEGQWFDNLYEFVCACRALKKIVVIAALDATFTGDPFQNTIRVLPLAMVEKHYAVCHQCRDAKRVALHTRLIIPTSITHNNLQQFDVNLVGGAEKYTVFCDECMLALQITSEK